LAITHVQNAVTYIGTLFVGMKLSKTAAHGIVKNVAHAGIGESGIVRFATGAAMVLPFLVKAVGIANDDFYKKLKAYHFFRDKSYPFVYGIVQKLQKLERPRQ
jgi:hypothetical protein